MPCRKKIQREWHVYTVNPLSSLPTRAENDAVIAHSETPRASAQPRVMWKAVKWRDSEAENKTVELLYTEIVFKGDHQGPDFDDLKVFKNDL
jgi:hypothetical protein